MSSKICDGCGKTYKTNYTLRRHQETVCGKSNDSDAKKILSLMKRSDNETTNLVLAELLKQNLTGNNTQVQLNSQNTKVSGSHNNIAGRDVNINNNTFHIHLNVLGHENTEMLYNEDTVEEVIQLLTQFKIEEGDYWEDRGDRYRLDIEKLEKALNKIYEVTHFNDEYPENHNIHVTNKKPEVPFLVYKENGWEKTNDFELIVTELIRALDRLEEVVKQKLDEEYEGDMFKKLKILQKMLLEDDDILRLRSNQLKPRELSSYRRKILNTSYNNKETSERSYRSTRDVIPESLPMIEDTT